MAKNKNKKPTIEEIVWTVCYLSWKDKDKKGWEGPLTLVLFEIDNNYDPTIPLDKLMSEEEYNSKINEWIRSKNGQEYAFVINHMSKTPTAEELFNNVIGIYYMHKENKSLFDELKNQSWQQENKEDKK